MKIYSPSKNAFYAKEFQSDYEASNSWPNDGIEVSDEQHAQIMAQLSSGKQLSHDENGHPVAIYPPTPVCTKDALIAEVAAKRWQVETSGIVVAGTPIATDREAQSLLNSAFVDLQSGLISDTQWKADNGTFTLVTLVQLEPVAKAVATHRRACFAVEQAHVEAITALQTQPELDAYDINTGWPSGK